MTCLDTCKSLEVSCPNKDCRKWIDYEDEFNCLLHSIHLHDKLTLRECAERLGISYVRVKQIEDSLLEDESLKEKMRNLVDIS